MLRYPNFLRRRLRKALGRGFNSSVPAAYFDELYSADADPWRFETSEYEREKCDATLAALPRQTYNSALEIGCSNGVMTEALATRCAALIALDVAEAPLQRARQRCSDRPHVSFVRMRVPEKWPSGSFHLILLSEILYFLDKGDVARLASCIRDSIAPGGTVVLMNWLGETHLPLTGDEAANHFIASTAAFARVQHQRREAAYRLDILEASSDRLARQ